MKTVLRLAVLSVAACGLGCDTYDANRAVDPVPTSPVPAADHEADVDINIDANRPLVEERAERRLDRRENLRDAVDKVDIDVGRGGVDVDVK